MGPWPVGSRGWWRSLPWSWARSWRRSPCRSGSSASAGAGRSAGPSRWRRSERPRRGRPSRRAAEPWRRPSSPCRAPRTRGAHLEPSADEDHRDRDPLELGPGDRARVLGQHDQVREHAGRDRPQLVLGERAGGAGARQRPQGLHEREPLASHASRDAVAGGPDPRRALDEGVHHRGRLEVRSLAVRRVRAADRVEPPVLDQVAPAPEELTPVSREGPVVLRPRRVDERELERGQHAEPAYPDDLVVAQREHVLEPGPERAPRPASAISSSSRSWFTKSSLIVVHPPSRASRIASCALVTPCSSRSPIQGECESMKPGRTASPSRSTTVVLGPAVGRTSSSEPTETIRSPSTATASATVQGGSRVITTASWRMRSGSPWALAVGGTTVPPAAVINRTVPRIRRPRRFPPCGYDGTRGRPGGSGQASWSGPPGARRLLIPAGERR